MFCAQTTLLELSFTAIVSSFPDPARLRELKTRQNEEQRREEAACVGRGCWDPHHLLYNSSRKSGFKSRKQKTEMQYDQKGCFCPGLEATAK